ncbi:MAG: hypothetical protein JRI97_13000 [Deltaproteobacteria bacterium]|nr:hypothetical protein [Deltaproteobacteria bacterium]
MKHLILILFCAALLLCGPALAATEAIAFESDAVGTAAEALPYTGLFAISGCGLEVVEEGAATGIVAYNANVGGIPDSVPNWLPGDNAKSLANASTSGCEAFTVTFSPDIVVSSFSLEIIDYGDRFPGGASAPYMVTLTAYDASGVQLGQLTHSMGSNGAAKDVATAGARGLTITAADIAYVELTTQDVDPDVSYDNFAVTYERRPIDVVIDIKPSTFPNSIDPRSNGVISVAILGSADFDVYSVDPATLSFNGLTMGVKSNGQPMCAVVDLNFDAYDDMVCLFANEERAWSEGQTEAELTGALWDGTPVSGMDSVRLVPPEEAMAP